MMKTVVLNRVDETFPADVEMAAQAVIQFLINHEIYITPFCRVLINIPHDFLGNVKCMASLETYFKNGFELNKYCIQSIDVDKNIKTLVGFLTSYFAFYDDVNLLDFIQRNSRYSTRMRENPEELQLKAFARLKGYIFERLATEMLRPCYQRNNCQFESGCMVEIDGAIVRVSYGRITRKTIDIAGIDTEHSSCNMVECKTHPIRIEEINVKYVKYLYKKMKEAGYTNVITGFVTAGTKESVRLKIAENLKKLNIDDLGVTVYDMDDLRLLMASA